MTPEKQRIAIAEVCGWTKCEHVESLNLTKGFPPVGFTPNYGTYENGMAQLTDYLKDLNAMHAALMGQSQKFRSEFDRLMHALAEEKQLLYCELESKDWADCFIETLGLQVEDEREIDPRGVEERSMM